MVPRRPTRSAARSGWSASMAASRTRRTFITPRPTRTTLATTQSGWRTAPSNSCRLLASGYGHQLYAKLNAVARRAFGCGDVVEVIDVEDALSYRIDGHGHDMLHWCLPGVPDWLIAVLFRFVLVDE